MVHDSGKKLPEGQSIRIIGYLGSAAEAFVQENSDQYNIVFERAVQPEDQTIEVNTSRTCIYGTKPFAIGASAKTAMTYETSDPAVADISRDGMVTLKGIGKAVITISAIETNEYNAASAKVVLNVKPGRPSLRAKNLKTRKVKIVWSKVAGASGYEVYIKCPGQKKFHKRAVKSARVKSITHSKLKKGKYYCYKVRAFTKVGDKKVYGAFSKAKKVRIKT
jgi:hypothetical protein